MKPQPHEKPLRASHGAPRRRAGLGEPEVLRDRTLSIRLTPAEAQLLEAAARVCGMEKGTFAYRILLMGMRAWVEQAELE
jgi:hypothetical protein